VYTVPNPDPKPKSFVDRAFEKVTMHTLCLEFGWRF